MYPGCAIIVAGNFNKLDIEILKRIFQLKQLVRNPTRGSNILDLIPTNLYKFYPSSIEILPLGITMRSQCNYYLLEDETVLKRDMRLSRIKWSFAVIFEDLLACDGKCGNNFLILSPPVLIL